MTEPQNSSYKAEVIRVIRSGLLKGERQMASMGNKGTVVMHHTCSVQ